MHDEPAEEHSKWQRPASSQGHVLTEHGVVLFLEHVTFGLSFILAEVKQTRETRREQMVSDTGVTQEG